MARLDTAAGETDDVAFTVGDLAGEHRGPNARDFADHGFDKHVGRCPSGCELLEIASVRNPDIRHRPHFRGIDQPAFPVEQIQGADVRKRGKPCAQHLVRGEQRHLLFEGFRRINSTIAYIGEDILVHVLEIRKLLVEVPRQQQRGVGKVAFGDLDCALPVLQRHVRGAERDRQHQRSAAQDKPLDGAHARADQRPCPR